MTRKRSVKAVIVRNRGLTAVETLLVISLVSVIAVGTIPLVSRAIQGYTLSQSRRLDRQFDPADPSYETSYSNSTTFTHTESVVPMPKAVMFRPTTIATQNYGGMDLSLSDLAYGAVFGEGIPTEMYNTSSGDGGSTYDYCDNVEGGCW